MNPLVKKEIRLLLPGFVIGVALTFTSWLFFNGRFESNWNWVALVVSLVACPMMAVFMALNSFGAEISAGTFSMLLAQPISRLKIWQTKISLLTVAMLVFGVLWFSPFFYLRTFLSSSPDNFNDLFNLFSCVVMFALVVFSGALWTVLLLRQVAAAFWFTLIVPGAIAAILAGLFSDKSDEFIIGITVSSLGIYSLGGFFYARRLFLRAQDAAWTGGTIVMPEMRGLAWMKINSGTRRFWRPRAAQVVKEFQLHQSQFVLAGALALLHLGILAEGKFGHIKKNSSTEFIIQIFWGLWLIMPMLVGAAAVAEERKMGTLEGQLCLPVKRRTQFLMKLSVVLFLSVLFGVLMPLLLEGTRILPDIHLEVVKDYAGFRASYGWQWQMSAAQAFLWNCLEQINRCLPLLTLAGMAAAIGAISFYASTFARNTLQTLGPAVLGILVTGFVLVGAYLPEKLINDPLWRGWLVYFIALPILTPTLIGLAFWNYKHVAVGWKMIRWNLFALAAALALAATVTTAIYHRAWEKLTPLEPAHGTARFTLSNPPTLHEQWNTSTLRLPDGRMWTDDYTFTYAFDASPPDPLAWLLGNIGTTPLAGGHFLDGSNWVCVVRGGWLEHVGIKVDGTLWVSESPARRERLANGGVKMTKAGDLVHFGSETNWSSIAWGGLTMLLVKNDGTLWRWGVTNWDNKLQWPGFRTFTPYRLGTESNWAEVFLLGYELCLRKTDGTVWTPLDRWTPWHGNQTQTLDLEPGFSVERTPVLEHRNWRGTTSIWGGLSYQLGVSADGTFRIWADQRLNNQSHSYEWTAVDLQFGRDTNWMAVAASGKQFVTLKNDGTLWLWNFHHDDWRGVDADRDKGEMLDLKPIRLGTHSDWIAIADTDGAIISLAADGGLWLWPLGRPSEFEHFYDYGDGDNSHFEPLLDMSRKPQLLGNVFGKSD
jgi:ABC-type transport system involved in multi-copper enzyme maturation permease subunit